MSNLFRDINGKAILPGSTVVVARHNSRWNKRIVLTKGVVYQTKVHLSYDGRPYGGTVGVIVDDYSRSIGAPSGSEVKPDKIKRTFRNLSAIMVVD